MILECGSCHALVKPEYIAEYSYLIAEDFPGENGQTAFWKCPNCDNPFLTDFDKVYAIYVLYPAADDRINPGLPEPIKSAYSEALSCFKSRAYTATAIMCRKTLEGICAEHGIKGNSLVSSLKELKDKGIIENRLYEWADALRISGNEAAHDVKVTILPEDARDILEFTHALLEYIFTFRDRFEQFNQHRASKTAEAGAES
jgi:Domain of unknown function (DUF4145)